MKTQDTRLTKLQGLAKKFADAYWKKKDLEEEIKDLNKLMLEELTPEMDRITNQLGIGGFEVPSLGNFSKQVKARVSFRAEKKDELKDVLREMGYNSLIKETVEANSVLGIVNEYDRLGKLLPKKLKECLNIYLQPIFKPPKKEVVGKAPKKAKEDF